MRTPRLATLAAALLVVATSTSCRPHPQRSRAASLSVSAIERGAFAYETYCAGCHGHDGRGGGPVAAAFGLEPPDLRPAIWTSSNAALLDRLQRGTPLDVPPRVGRDPDARDVDALAAYLPRAASADWSVLRAGRVVYEEACGACHGMHGRGDTAVAYWLGAPGMIEARERQSDAALARISEVGTGQMPPLYGAFDRTEIRALVAYIRHLSDGFAVYDSYCAACHGDDGRGRASAELLRPAMAAPALRAPYDRTQLRVMLRRERGVMPHFPTLGPGRLEDILAYLRAVVARAPASVSDSDDSTTAGG